MAKAATSEKRINIPLAPETHRALRQQAGSLGVTMYELAAKAIEAGIENRTVEVVADPNLGDVRTEEAIAAIEGDADAPVSICRHYMNLNKPHLAAVMATVAAERTARGRAGHPGDPARASRELTRFAGERLPIAIKIALLDRALSIHSENLVANNLLGQQLYFDGQYKRAIEHLAVVRERDNRARLFHGFSILRVALEAGDGTRTRVGRDEVVEALESWSFGSRDPQDRQKWIRQLAELEASGRESDVDFSQTIDELIEYANMNSDWRDPISRTDLVAAHERSNSARDEHD